MTSGSNRPVSQLAGQYLTVCDYQDEWSTSWLTGLFEPLVVTCILVSQGHNRTVRDFYSPENFFVYVAWYKKAAEKLRL
jgi:hypothetical protein